MISQQIQQRPQRCPDLIEGNGLLRAELLRFFEFGDLSFQLLQVSL